jgi:predicted RNA methylase
MDRSFDRFLPEPLRRVSGQYWTPLEVVMRAATWFDDLGVRSVVDIGSGAGKFCVASALVGERRCTGVEHRPRLVRAAEELARRFRVDDRVSFVVGAVGHADLPPADAYYLYNPFGENVFGPSCQLDGEVELSRERYAHDVAAVESFFRRCPPGTFVVTYNGFGGRVPAAFEETRVDRELPNVLRMWRKLR